MVGRLLRIAGMALGPLGLALHFYVAMRFSLETGRSIIGGIIFYFSFFTILTHILSVLTYWASLPGAPAFLSVLGGARARAGVVTALAVVSVVYNVALSNLWDPQGAAYLGDIILHYLAPAIYLAWWLTAGRDGSLSFRDLPWLLVFPIGYFAYVMARAPIAGEVPYPFLDLAQIGMPGVARSALLILLLFIVAGAVFVLIDRTLGSSRTVKSQV